MRFKFLFKAIAMTAAALCTQAAVAQTFPAKAINMVVPYPAGGALDNAARVMSKEMAINLKQPIVVENVVGVVGALGTAKALAAPPDGYTVLVSEIAALILTPLANANAKYKAEDFKTVSMIRYVDIMLVVRKDLGVNSISELIALAKKATNKPLSYCTSGIGSNYHLMAERFNAVTGMKGLHVPYNGFPQCATDLIGQVIDYAFLPISGPFPAYVDNGNVKMLGVTGSKTNQRFTKAPLIKNEKGLDDFVFNAWSALHVSSKVSDDVVSALHKSAQAALETESVKASFAANGASFFGPMSPSEAHALYLREVAAYRAIAKSINLQQQQ